jgi:aspartyl-tRNA(Asn)/glutamyl-tRNA(Gln) amidotransferase subunit A
MTQRALEVMAADRLPDRAFATIEALAEALAMGRSSSAELVELGLERIGRLDGRLHAFVRVFAEPARQAAAAADAMRASGRLRSRLHGIPFAIKDLLDYAGSPTEAGSAARTGVVSTETATAVRRLEAAGMIAIGKTHTVEFGFGGWGINEVTGTPWNPWDAHVHRAPGGSSSGSAVAVAAGLVPAALGTDTGGSCRIPAAFCGIVGVKTSRGLVGRGGLVPLSPTHDTVGPLVRSVRDAALLIETLAGFDPLDSVTAGAPVVRPLADVERGVADFRIGSLPEAELADLEPDVRTRYGAALEALKDGGASIREFSLPRPLEDYVRQAGELMSAESYAHLESLVEAPNCVIHPVIRARIRRGRDISAAHYIRLLEARRAAQAAMAAAMDRIDALVTPTCLMGAPPVAEIDENCSPSHYGRFVNFLDLASVSLPVGSTQAGLPVGLQVVVRRFDDPLALRVARMLEKALGGYHRPPRL